MTTTTMTIYEVELRTLDDETVFGPVSFDSLEKAEAYTLGAQQATFAIMNGDAIYGHIRTIHNVPAY